jgi:hypothetical protein
MGRPIPRPYAENRGEPERGRRDIGRRRFVRRFTVDVKKYLATVYDPANAIPKQWKIRPPPSTLIGVTALSEPCQLMETDVFAVVHDKR